MKYTEITFTITPDSQTARDLIAAFAGEGGVDSLEEVNGNLVGYIPTEKFDREHLETILKELPLADVEVSFETQGIEDCNWNAVWEANGFDPIDVDGRCIIYDAKRGLTDYQPQEDGESPMLVGIDAIQAFGSGTHETTQAIVSSLFGMNIKDKRVLDCGCGTGILGIVAAKLGAKDVVGFDIDEWSVRNALHNAELNQVEMEIFEGDRNALTHASGLFDIIMANINRNVLLADMSSYAEVLTHDGQLIISGFYETDIPSLEEEANRLGLRVYRQVKRGDWCCLLLQRLSAQVS